MLHDSIVKRGEKINLSKLCLKPFKRQPHKMVKLTQTIRRLLPTNRLIVFDHSVGLALKGLIPLGNCQPTSTVSHFHKYSFHGYSKSVSLRFLIEISQRNTILGVFFRKVSSLGLELYYTRLDETRLNYAYRHWK